MNRIRFKNNSYQVLHTPNLVIFPSMELLNGSWDDDTLKGFYVEEYDSLSKAQCAALQLPDINWYQLVRMNIDHYHQLNNIIGEHLKRFNFFANKESHLMTPEELKEVMFDRVLNFGARFTTTYNMNDIITINIVDPWTKNLHKIANLLKNDPNLRIINKKIYWNKIIILTGETELGFTYEIKLFPTILWKWAKWTNWYGFTNKNENKQAIEKQRKNAMNLQEKIDKSMRIR